MKKTSLLFALFALFIFNSKAQTTVNDADGNVYNTVIIGTQVWIKENLNTTKYNDSTAITKVTSSSSWGLLTSGAYCDYNNTPSYSSEYGKLYNWYAINTTTNGGKNLCPTGWHVPSDTELTSLTTFLGGDPVAGGKLKETGYLHWINPNVGATNSSGFTARAGGYRNQNGTSQNISTRAYLGSATEYTSTTSWYLKIFSDYSSVLMDYGLKCEGFSVRCLKDGGATIIDEEKDNINMQIFPNPASDILTISAVENMFSKLSIINIVGEVVLTSEYSNKININFLTNGVYIIQLSGSKGIVQQKLIKK